MTQHPDLAQEQAYVDRAYECLERTRQDAWKLRMLTEAGLGGTFQARYERDVFDEAIISRLTQLDLGEAALVFGRIDRAPDNGGEPESYHIGRLAVADEEREPVVDRLAGPRGRALLPRHRPQPHGPGPPAPLRQQGPPRSWPSRTSCSARATSGSPARPPAA